MGGNSRKSRRRKPSPEPSNSSYSKLRKRLRDRGRDGDEGRRTEKLRSSSEKKEKKKHSRNERERRKRREKNKRKYDSDEESGSGSDSESENPEDVVKYILKEFPAVAGDLEQLLRMIDDGQAVDIRGLSEKSLVKQLRRLFIYLNLKEKGDQVFLLPRKANPTMDVVGPIISSHVQLGNEPENLDSQINAESREPESECKNATDNVDDDTVGPKRR